MVRIIPNLPLFSVVLQRFSYNSFAVNHCHHIVELPLKSSVFNFLNPLNAETFLAPSRFGFSFSPFSASSIRSLGISTDAPAHGLDEAMSDDDTDEDDGTHCSQLHLKDYGLAQDVKTILDIMHESGYGASKIKQKLEHCSVMPSSELVVEILSRTRNDWDVAFTFFLWAGKQLGYAHSAREYNSMISILGKMRKFDTAWTLIEEMRGGRMGPSLVTSQTLLIMIRRYCAVHDVARAINTFYAYKRFDFQVRLEEFQSLLSALCRYKNVEDAEHLLFCNKNVFPFDTKSFNIILNGWCNMIVSTRHAERIWQEMSKRGIQHDVVSYASIISCYSKSSKLYMVLRLFDEMKKRRITPDRKVYNAVIYALAKVGLVIEAVNLVGTMEDNNVTPDVVTYNSLIKPLCKARKIDEAKEIFDQMLKRSLSPTIQTFHAFFRILRTKEEVFELLDKMRELRCYPITETYIMLIRKFCRWRQLDDVFKLWDVMREDGISHDRSSYIVLIHGLFLNGKLEEAYNYYTDMQEKGFLPEPKTEKMLQAWVSGRQVTETQATDLEHNQLEQDTLRKKVKAVPSKFDREKAFLRQPETRRVTRERGFSFWEQ
ncbi:pentatricopeptide repeat-containing protein At5g15010, mitochondrial [Abrus precatorius]|uniref:Pentatricopeptide repeat-containing protein At5g15010, mitochondrial n=1 Tax=Abrus precatorius TaxID=3816 RepID=A0A8B8L0E8_ABRPR|nr:pentatricopeptide repeat-containing protein At5g15010, mitochondrial [Abrus precatorius]XP_027349648.1 pentatricopeptide repeat-containing protein At5g15010, mitochondrial [Abrus precatorius]XP_027349649.1 pentatricopeptide repeat-containing protein At5g15010, mitochondrial [Abrus precatorius]XP_027349650.1 pentatricopeptide repeat-containing protein At5g15010, mitochondrial [Abrus precatorius]